MTYLFGKINIKDKNEKIKYKKSLSRVLLKAFHLRKHDFITLILAQGPSVLIVADVSKKCKDFVKTYMTSHNENTKKEIMSINDHLTKIHNDPYYKLLNEYNSIIQTLENYNDNVVKKVTKYVGLA